MNAALDVTLQALGLRKLAPTTIDFALNRKLFTDELGRTLPMSGQYLGTAPASWLGNGAGDLAKKYADHGTVFSIINYILTTAGPIPWGVYKLDGEDNRATLQPKHPLAGVLYRPNPRQSWAEFKTQCEGPYLVNGQCFIRRVKPVAGTYKGGKTGELWCLVGKVELLPLNGLGEFDAPTGYRHHDALTGKYQDYPADEIIHIKTWNPLNPHIGLSPLAAGNDSVTAAKSGMESRVKQYQNSGPPLLLADANGEAMTKEQAEGVQGWFGSFFAGRRREGRIPILTGSKMAAIRLGLSPVDLDVLAAIPHDKDAIADLLHFPGQLLNGSKGTTFSNMAEAGAALYTRCIIPLETALRDGLNRALGPEYKDEVYIDFDVSHIAELQPNKEKLAAWLKDAYWITTQDKQRMMGVPVDEKLPKYLFGLSVQTLEELTGAVPPAGDDVAG